MADTLNIDIEKNFPSGARVAAALEVAIDAGGALVLFGPSGAGKTTVVRSIAGLERPDRGSICWGGRTWFDSAAGVWVEPQRRHIGYVAQESALFPHLTVKDNVAYGLRRFPEGDRERLVADSLALFELTALALRRAGTLSGGEARRVAIARALAPRPQLLLLDEPLSALDTPTRGRVRGEIRAAIRRTGVAAVVVTHERADAIALGDRMAVLVEGAVRQVGSVAEVFSRPADLAVARTVGIESVIAAQIGRVEDGLVELQVGRALLRAADVQIEAGRTEVFACIRAEDVMIARQASPGGSARNHLAGRVVAIEHEGSLERVTLDCGFPLTATITRSARDEMALAEGALIVAVVKATAIHLV